MTPSEAKRTIQTIPSSEWIFHPKAGEHARPALGVVNSSITPDVVQALGIQEKDALPYKATGGDAWIFHNEAVNILADAGAQFSQKASFVGRVKE